MESRNIILVGGGGHCRSCIDVLETAGYSIEGILDNNSTRLFNYSIIGDDTRIPGLAGSFDFLITVGQVKSPAARIKLYNLIKEAGGRLATVISTTAVISKYAVLGEGTIAMHQAVINAGTRVGNNCIINNKALIEHDCVVGDDSHISTGAILNGNCIIGSRVFAGSGCVLANSIKVCDDVVIGAGAVVIENISEPGVFAGNPARKIS